MITLHLYGKLKKLCGAVVTLHVESLPAALRLLEANYPGKIRGLIEKDSFHVCRGKTLGKHINLEDEGMLTLVAKPGTHFHIIPKAIGAAGGMKKKGLGAILLGALLLGVSFFFGFTPGIQAGLSLILGGASLLLTPDTKSKSEDEAKSYSFSGPTNASEQGGTKAVIYGRVRAGTTTAAASIKTINTGSN